MAQYHRWIFPELPAEIADLFQQNERKLVVVGIIGKSAHSYCNKMALLNVLDTHQILCGDNPEEGRISFYYNVRESLILVHFETTFDGPCMQKYMLKKIAQKILGNFLQFNQELRSRFARMLLFATQICHIIVFVEVNISFDTSLLAIFKAIKIIREKHVQKFLPKLIKNSNIGSWLGKSARLCTPRLLFLFENCPTISEKTREVINKLENGIEDNIYKMFRTEFIMTHNNNTSLFNLPSNKRFVYYNTNAEPTQDPLEKSVNLLKSLLLKPNFKEDVLDDMDELLPYNGFGRPVSECSIAEQNLDIKNMQEERNFMALLRQHVNEALETGFDESSNKHKRSNITFLSAKDWYETFRLLYKIFIENPDNEDFEANDADYKAYLENFNRIVNIDDDFFNKCSEIGLNKAFNLYNSPALTHYNAQVHENMLREAIGLYKKIARGSQTLEGEEKLRQMCTEYWQNGRQQCCFRSLRGNECIMPLHKPTTDFHEHSSGYVFLSTCNCGRQQGRREDPYSMRDANYEFYEYMASNCNLCCKVKKINFAVFEPSINDYRAADVEAAFPKLQTTHKKRTILTPTCTGSDDNVNSGDLEKDNTQLHHHIASQGGLTTNLSLECSDKFNKLVSQEQPDDGDDDDDYDDDNISSEEDEGKSEMNELVLQVQEKGALPSADLLEREANIVRQPSTTEYLPGMVHTESPVGLLPQFPSWSLVCVGSSSVYSHNTGLMEHFQSGFLSGANYLLPWDVHVRLEQQTAATWASHAYEKSRYRKLGQVLILKIFVGCEYECPRGHRFIMSAPDKILRGASGIARDSGNKVVFNNMPLYFPCPCRSAKSYVAQLMRVHVVTPKAPVNVIVNPKVQTGDYTFTLGLPQPPKLTQSAYWMLRLPYVYQGDDAPILPPTEITAQNAINYGCLLAGMFGVSETEVDE